MGSAAEAGTARQPIAIIAIIWNRRITTPLPTDHGDGTPSRPVTPVHHCNIRVRVRVRVSNSSVRGRLPLFVLIRLYSAFVLLRLRGLRCSSSAARCTYIPTYCTYYIRERELREAESESQKLAAFSFRRTSAVVRLTHTHGHTRNVTRMGGVLCCLVSVLRACWARGWYVGVRVVCVR